MASPRSVTTSHPGNHRHHRRYEELLPLERIGAVEVHEIPERHEFLRVNIDASLASTKLLSSNIYLNTDVLDHLKNIIKALVMSLRVVFQHVIFLNFISFLRNYIPIVFPINNSKNFNIIFVKCHCLIHDIAHLSAFTLDIL